MNSGYEVIETIWIISGIISIITLITFFVMAYRLGTIMDFVKQIGNRMLHTPFYEAQTEELLGKNKEAVEKYIKALYIVTTAGYTLPKTEYKKESTIFLVEKITKLGGNVPERLKEMNPYL